MPKLNGEGGDGVAVIEVADVTDAGIPVVGAVGVRAAHRPDRNVLEDRKGAELRGCGRHARVARRPENRNAGASRTGGRKPPNGYSTCSVTGIAISASPASLLARHSSAVSFAGAVCPTAEKVSVDRRARAGLRRAGRSDSR